MFDRLMRAMELWLIADTGAKLIGWVLLVFTMYMLWQLYRGLDSFAVMMGL